MRSKRVIVTAHLAALYFGQMWAQQAWATYPHVEFPELVHSADVIFVGTVTSTTPRLGVHERVIVTDVAFRVEALVHAGDAVTTDVAQRITLTFAGGQIGDRGLSVSGVPTFTVGQSYLVFARYDGQPYFNPLIGGGQGLFKIMPDAANQEVYPVTLGGLGIAAVGDSRLEYSPKVDRIERGVAVAAPAEIEMAPPGQPLAGSAHAAEPLRSVAPAALVSLNQFITRIQSTLEQPAPSDRVLRGVWNSTEASPNLRGQPEKTLSDLLAGENAARAEDNLPPIANLFDRPADDTVPRPPAPPRKRSENTSVTPLDEGQEGPAADSGARAALCYCGAHNRFLTMEQVPTSWWEWGENNYAMALYNLFMDLYRYVDDDGSYGNNGENEFGGYPSNQDLIDNYGQGWGGSIAVCWTFWSSCSCCTITQSDVFFNPAFAWYQNFSDTFNQSSRTLYRPNVLHELGHSWGMQRGTCTEDYSYSQISVMHAYYNNIVEDGYGIHHPEAYSIRRAYQSQTGIIPRKDVGVESYYASGSLINSTVSDSWYYTGESITINNITVENNSHVATQGVRLRFYLSTNNIISTGDYQMGSYWFWDSFPAETYSTGTYATSVPNVPPGIYYIGAIVTTDGDAFNGDDLWYNDATYLASTVEIRLPPPSNNWCSSAPAVGLGSTFGATAGANTDGSASCGFSNSTADVWYAFTAPCSGILAADTCGSSYDTVLSIHSACAGTTDNELECNDDCVGLACGLRDSCLTEPVTAGQTYFIRLSGYEGAAGNFALNLSYAPPSNNDCTGAPGVSEGAYAFSNCGATTDGPNEPVACNYFGDSQVGADVWYSYVAGCTGSATVSLCGSGYDTKVAAYDGCPGGETAILACADDSCGLQSEISFPVSQGATYLVRIGGYGGATGQGVLNISCEGTGVPAATLAEAVSRKINAAGPEGVCDVPLVPGVQSEPRQGGITELRLLFDMAPGGPGPNPVTVEEATCAAPAYAPYSGASVLSATLAGNELVLSFSPALENARTYRLAIGADVTSVAGQLVEISGLQGDVNSDGTVNGTDRSVVVGVWTGGGFSCPTDLNSSGATNGNDRSVVVGAWTGPQNCAP